jgi:xylulokinase
VPQEKPAARAATDVLGPLLAGPAGALGVPAGLPVVTGTPDLHSAAIGSGATRDFQAHLYVGTSSWLTCHVPFKRTDMLRNIASLPSAIPGRYFVADEQESAGAALTFLRDRVLFDGDPPPGAYRAFDQMAASAPAGSSGVIFTPWLYGERTPVEDHLLRRVPQPVPVGDPRRSGPCRVRGGRAEHQVAAERGGAVHQAAA